MLAASSELRGGGGGRADLRAGRRNRRPGADRGGGFRPAFQHLEDADEHDDDAEGNRGELLFFPTLIQYFEIN